MEKLLIITEKPSARRNFAKALGGDTGNFEGNDYVLVNLIGHILTHETPEKVAYPNHAQTVGPFSKTDSVPWSTEYFDFDKKVLAPHMIERAGEIVRGIETYLNAGYIPVIASDIDAMGEGDLLVQEVLTYLNYKGKIYREYHKAETPNDIQKAMREKKDVTNGNPGVVAAQTRSTLDFLTQGLVRVATMSIQDQGYRLPRPVPVGRLQSTILRMIGDQLHAFKTFKPSSNFESRYKVDNLVLSAKGLPLYPTKEAWTGDGLPAKADVKELKQVVGRTIPPKALTLTQLGKLMSQKGMKSKQSMKMAQAMYDDSVITYPRTEDDFIAPEQFTEMLPHVDTYIGLLGLSTAVFTHRTMRSTHVKEGGSHGALRPGVVIPSSLGGLDAKYGKGAAEMYKLVTERYLMMFLEDTEWVRHEYATVGTTPVFTGSIRIITKQGVIDPNEDVKDVETQLPNISKGADLYAHEVKARKPKSPSEAWLLNELEKQRVGTASTQLPTVGRMIGADGKFPIAEGKMLELSPIGQVGYLVAREISLGTPECTRSFEDMIKKVIKGGTDQQTIFKEFENTLREDVSKIKQVSFDLDALGFDKAAQKVSGTWNGTDVSIPKTAMGYTFTDSELQQLFAGQTVTFTGVDFNKNPISVSVKLGNLMHEGRPYVGFLDTRYAYGVWQKNFIRFRRSFMGYDYTDAECDTLLAGGSISFTGVKKDGSPTEISGKLANQKMGANKFVGLAPEFADSNHVQGTYNGKAVSFNGTFMGHTFTPEEIITLLTGESIVFDGESAKGWKGKVSGKLGNSTYQGKKTFGFIPDFGKKKKQKL